MKRIIIYSIILTLFGIACTNLDEELYSSIPNSNYPENDEQVANLSVEAYNDFKNLIDDGWWWFLTQEISGDGIVFPTRGADWDDNGKWRALHEHTWNDDIDAVNGMWNLFIAAALNNQTLERLKGLPSSDAVLSKIKEVETVRSFYYYLLLDNYGDIPYVSITVNEGAQEQPDLLPRSQVFDSIVTCVKNALPYLKPLNTSLMATKTVGYALLAKLYLNAEVYTGTAQWELAELYTDSVLQGPQVLNPIGDVVSSFQAANGGNLENIFTISFDEIDSKGFRLHRRTLHYQSDKTFNMTVGPWNGGCLMYDQWKTYDVTDLRREKWFLVGEQKASDGTVIIDDNTKTPLTFTPEIPHLLMNAGNSTSQEIRMSGARLVKYEIEMGAGEDMNNDFPLFRLSDFYLMKAELMLRQGKTDAEEYVNPIRVRAGLDDLATAGVTLDLDEILAERGRELILEGHRRQDLIRFGKFTDAWWEKKAGTDDELTFPIPKWAKDANPKLDN